MTAIAIPHRSYDPGNSGEFLPGCQLVMVICWTEMLFSGWGVGILQGGRGQYQHLARCAGLDGDAELGRGAAGQRGQGPGEHVGVPGAAGGARGLRQRGREQHVGYRLGGGPALATVGSVRVTVNGPAVAVPAALVAVTV